MRLKFYLVLILTFFFFSSCTREFNNPLDPESLAYTPPSVEIVKPFENETISSTAVTIMWVGNKPEANEYRFRLVDYSDWSEWTTATSASFDYLDDAEYTFEIEVRYKGHTDVRKFSRKFKVDAINGPTLKFYKLKNIVNLGGEFYVSVWVEEVINFKSVQVLFSFAVTVIFSCFISSHHLNICHIWRINEYHITIGIKHRYIFKFKITIPTPLRSKFQLYYLTTPI